jgi:hypothetical protein
VRHIFLILSIFIFSHAYAESGFEFDSVTDSQQVLAATPGKETPEARCQRTVINMAADINKSKGTSLSALQADLGTPRITSEILSDPTSTKTETLNKYIWSCHNPDYPSVFDTYSVVVTTDQNGKILTIQAKDDHDTYQVVLALSELQKELQEKSHEAAKAALIKSYNEKQHTQWQTMEQLDKDIIQKYKDYYTQLRGCMPGVYTYFTKYDTPTMTTFTENSAIIEGKSSSGLCKVKNILALPANAAGQSGKAVFTCQYQPQNLAIFTDEQAAWDAMVADPTQASAGKSNQINWKDCKVEMVGG